MGDMADDFNAMRARRQEQHAQMKERNTHRLTIATIEGRLLIFKATNNGETLLFREPNKPKVDFYPSTGRWRVAGITKTFRGGAESFLRWYEKQSASKEAKAYAKYGGCTCMGHGQCDFCKERS